MKAESGKRKAESVWLGRPGCLRSLASGLWPLTSGFRPPASSRSAFTLVELLAVVALIGLMMMVAMPAMQTGKGSSLISAARQFSNDLNLARQYGIARNYRMRVVIATERTIKDSGTSLPDWVEMQYRAYAVMYQQRAAMQWGGAYAPNTGNAPANQPNLPRGRIEWLYLQDWRFLPKGVIFDPSDSDLKSADGKNLPLPKTTIFFDTMATRDLWDGVSRDILPFPYRNTASDPRTGCEVAFIEFKSTGTPIMSGSVRLVNGIVQVSRGGEVSGTVIVPGRESAKTASANNDPAAVNSVVLSWDDFVGKIKWTQPGR